MQERAGMTGNDPSSSDLAMASLDVDPKVAATFAAWATELAGRAVWASGRATVPEWVGTAAELLYDWAAALPWASDGLDAGLAVATAVAAVQLAIRTAVITGDEVPAWAGTVAGLLEGWSQ